MVQHRRIKYVRDCLGIRTIEDWSQYTPADVLSLENVGPQTLDEVRYWLAARGQTLAGDMTPQYWSMLGSRAQIGTRLADSERYLTAPFTVLIDDGEQLPWTFQGLRGERRGQMLPLVVPTTRRHLGESRGDYTIDGWGNMIAIERKNPDDARSTILGFGDRRDAFKRTLRHLAGLQYSAVIVECTMSQLIQGAEARGKRSVEENAKTIHRSVLAWSQDYRVPWLFCDGRRLAETSAFRIMERAFGKLVKPKRKNSDNENGDQLGVI